MADELKNLERIQVEFVELLDELTHKGKAEWFRQNDDSAYVYCFCGNDLISFELSDDTEGNLNPFNNTHAILGKVRNHSFMWLEGLYGWERLIKLVHNAEVNEDKYRKYKLKMPYIIIDELRAL